jgi:hypothetical protein
MVGGVSWEARGGRLCAPPRCRTISRTSIINLLVTLTTISRALHCPSFMLTDEVTLVYT